MSDWNSIKCCKSIFALLEKQTKFKIVEGPGFKFKDDGIYITAKDEDRKSLSVKLFEKEDNQYICVFKDTEFGSLNLLMINFSKNDRRSYMNEHILKLELHKILSDFFALNYQKL